MNKTIILVIIIALVLIIGGIYFILQPKKDMDSNQFQIQGMKVEILKEGTGDAAKTGDSVLVNYTGTLEDGAKFDSSYDRNEPLLVTLGQNQVIQGWELGLLGMKTGEIRKLTIPPELAYGSTGAGEIIPANATLIFQVELLSINK